MTPLPPAAKAWTSRSISRRRASSGSSSSSVIPAGVPHATAIEATRDSRLPARAAQLLARALLLARVVDSSGAGGRPRNGTPSRRASAGATRLPPAP